MDSRLISITALYYRRMWVEYLPANAMQQKKFFLDCWSFRNSLPQFCHSATFPSAKWHSATRPNGKNIRQKMFGNQLFGKRAFGNIYSENIHSEKNIKKFDNRQFLFRKMRFGKIAFRKPAILKNTFGNSPSNLNYGNFLQRNDYIRCQVNARHRTWNWFFDFWDINFMTRLLGYIDVGDGCWRQNQLMTIFRCWRQIEKAYKICLVL